jgi:hypothetical protein
MENLHPTLKAFITEGERLGFKVEFDGTIPQWIDDEGHSLEYRGEGQALPGGAVVLYAFGGSAKSGKWFALDDVLTYHEITGLNVVIFERE